MSRTLRPTMRSSMWSTMPTPWRPPISAQRSISSTRPRRSPSSDTGQPSSKPISIVSGSSGARSGGVTISHTSSRGGSREVLDRPALGRAAPDVVVDRVRRSFRPSLDRDAVLAGVGDLLLAAHLPAAHRRDHLQLRDRATRPWPRCAPGRCPCRCNRARSCRTRSRAPSRRRASRSADGPSAVKSG